jgi:hypothetical protein
LLVNGQRAAPATRVAAVELCFEQVLLHLVDQKVELGHLIVDSLSMRRREACGGDNGMTDSSTCLVPPHVAFNLCESDRRTVATASARNHGTGCYVKAAIVALAVFVAAAAATAAAAAANVNTTTILSAAAPAAAAACRGFALDRLATCVHEACFRNEFHPCCGQL